LSSTPRPSTTSCLSFRRPGRHIGPTTRRNRQQRPQRAIKDVGALTATSLPQASAPEGNNHESKSETPNTNNKHQTQIHKSLSLRLHPRRSLSSSSSSIMIVDSSRVRRLQGQTPPTNCGPRADRAQSAFLGAKDRAMQDKDLRGIRRSHPNGPTFSRRRIQRKSRQPSTGFVLLPDDSGTA